MKALVMFYASTALAFALLSGTTFAQDADRSCTHRAGQWLNPVNGETLATAELFERLGRARVVLLGEEHTNSEHHRWQSYVLAALHARNPNMVVGFEMLPRRAQPALDAWSAGTLSEKAFLDRSDWHEVWGYDASLYLPLFHFARLNRLPALALNVDRELVSLVSSKGREALSKAQRENLPEPAPAREDYRVSLARLYAYKQAARDGQAHSQISAPDPDELKVIQRSEAFLNFVAAQLTWDRAMAEALAAAHHRDQDALVVGIVGRGHLEYGHGIPHQLTDLGIDDALVLLPVGRSEACADLASDLATALFVLNERDDEEPEAPRPRLGVMIESADGGVRVLQVVDGSVAARGGVLAGDLIASAAGFTTETPADLIEIVSRQAPGTWLPLSITRGDEKRELVARFPQHFIASP